MLRTALATMLLVVGCSSVAPPGASPFPSPPTPTGQPSAVPTEAPTATAATTAGPTPAPTRSGSSYDYDYGDDDKYTPRPTPAASATPAPAGDELVIGTSDDNTYLVDPGGRSLYTFDEDGPGVSNCTGGCAENWPPLTVAPGEQVVAGEGAVGTFATIEREDGSLQVTYNDAPLYNFAGDSAPGDTNGQGIGDVWFLANP